MTPGAVLSDFEQICVGLPVSGALIAVRELTGLRCTVSFGNAPTVGSRLAGDAAFTMRCVEIAEVVLCNDAATDLRIGPLVATRLGFRSAAAVPIETQGSVVGVIEVFCPSPNAITETVVEDLQRVAKSFASLMIFDAANGGAPIVGGSLEEPIELPRLIDEQDAVLAVLPITDRIEAPQSVIGSEPIASVIREAVEESKTKLVAHQPVTTGKVAGLSPLPSDRRTPGRVWFIAGALLFALSLLLLFLYLSSSHRPGASIESRLLLSPCSDLPESPPHKLPPRTDLSL